jgi:hypothetical protein
MSGPNRQALALLLLRGKIDGQTVAIETRWQSAKNLRSAGRRRKALQLAVLMR